jgi:uncharacterized damage-inducible protein DinB
MFALYNRWANQRLYQAALQLPAESFTRDCGAFFTSLSGTLNHLLLTDRMWLARLEGQAPRGGRLDEILYPRLEDLASARRREDDRLLDYIYGLPGERLSETLNYSTTAGIEMAQPLHQVLAHIFNHQTHHRGQAHDLICRLAGPAKAPVLDLIAYQRIAALSEPA